jgi:hypothetical protein
VARGFREVEADELVVSTRGDLGPAGATRVGSPEAAVEAARHRGDDLVVTGGATLDGAASSTARRSASSHTCPARAWGWWQATWSGA